MTNLFSEYIIKGKKIRNRIVMPPMVCFGWTDNSGIVSDKHVRHYEARAKGGVGLIIIEAVCVKKEGRLSDTQLGIWSDGHIDGLSKLANTCRENGAVTLVQIHHSGIKTKSDLSDDIKSPSGYEINGKTAPAYSDIEIAEIREAFIDAAVRAQKAGFDGIELHGAHGYLLNQFASPNINKREDLYGIDMPGRLKLAEEIILEIRRKLGNDFIIGYRMGGNEPTLEDGVQIAIFLEKIGVDILHVSASGFSDVHPEVPDNFPFSWITYCGAEVKRHVKIPVISVYGIKTPEEAGHLVENGYTDFAAIGRGLLADPEWAGKAKVNQKIKNCLNCRPSCGWFTLAGKCPRYLS